MNNERKFSKWFKFLLPPTYVLFLMKMYAPKKIANNLIVEYIYWYEGLEEMSTRPHSHLWDSIEYVGIFMTLHEKRAYIRHRLKWREWIDLCFHGKELRIHEHGKPDTTPKFYIDLVLEADINFQIRLSLACLVIFTSLLAINIAYF